MKNLTWNFPLPRTHTGMPLGNGIVGLMVWGEETLRITIGRAGFWDHRGGNAFQNRTDYPTVKNLLLKGDEKGLREVFGLAGGIFDSSRPHQVGGGQLEFTLPDGAKLRWGELLLEEGEVNVHVEHEGMEHCIVLHLSSHQELAHLTWPEGLAAPKVRLHPSWEWISEEMIKLQCEPPLPWQDGDSMGFVQKLPEDQPLAMAIHPLDQGFLFGTYLGDNPKEGVIARVRTPLVEAMADRQLWWDEYWGSVPSVNLPDPLCQELFDYGLYLQACSTPPQGLACGLQGPFLEEFQLPPWSADYHFNVNIQMIYWPALATNRLSHLEPLWEMIRKWWPNLKKGAESFFGSSEAIMLPHAVDDRCQAVGSFWTGCIDHGCTAWMALLAWHHSRYGADDKLLKELAFPMLKGAFAGYQAMLEEKEDGGLELPVSVSPEYKGAAMDAFGSNASFQLAACHAVVKALEQAAEQLDEEIDPHWKDVQNRLPPFSTIVAKNNDEFPSDVSERIALWEGQDLDGSHRHHSHLAGITPFNTLDPKAKGKEAEIIDNSLKWWTRRGPGAWSGWCVPWASGILTRAGFPDGALQWLRVWNSVFTNEGRGSLHDADFPGFSCLATAHSSHKKDKEIMQLDGRFGALQAVIDLLLFENPKGEMEVLSQLPQGWSDLEFSNFLCPGAFKVSAKVSEGRTQRMVVEAQAPRKLSLRHHLPTPFLFNGSSCEDEVLAIEGTPGKSYVLEAI